MFHYVHFHVLCTWNNLGEQYNIVKIMVEALENKFKDVGKVLLIPED